MLGSSIALEQMEDECWDAAYEAWRSLLAVTGDLSCDDFDAYAYVCEKLERWDEHRLLIERAQVIWPDEPRLIFRKILNDAIRFMERRDWDSAWIEFEKLRAGQPSHLKSSIGYYRNHVRISRILLGISEPAERLRAIYKASLFKIPEVYPSRAAGLPLVIPLLGLESSVEKLMQERFAQLEPYLRATDRPIRYLNAPGWVLAVSQLADFWHAHAASIKNLPSAYLDFFCRVFLCHGYLDHYLSIRGELVRSINCASGPETPAEWIYQLTLANEQMDSRKFDDLRLCVNNFAFPQEQLNDFLKVCSPYHNRRAEWEQKEGDREFGELICGRTVAVVGPVDVGLLSGSEIDGFDVVVRFNHRDDIYYRSDVFGGRTNVSYYIGDSLPEEEDPALINAARKLKFMVVDEFSLKNRAWLGKAGCKVRGRLGTWTYLECPMLCGYPWAVPRALLDLMRFEPSKIKVFCADMNTGINYQKEYVDLYYKSGAEVRGHWNIFPGLSLHDPISNFLLMKNMRSNGFIEVDQVLENVLSNTTEGYVELLRFAHIQAVKYPRGGQFTA